MTEVPDQRQTLEDTHPLPLGDTRPLAAVPPLPDEPDPVILAPAPTVEEAAVVFQESRFTPPREGCPNPERWHSVSADAPETEVVNLVAALAEVLQPAYAVLCGSGAGYTAEAVGRTFLSNGRGAVDVLDTAGSHAARQRCSGLPVTVIEASALLFQPRGPIDLLWLDDRAETCGYSLARFLPFLSPRALVAAHDAAPGGPVRDQVGVFEREGVLRPLYLPTPRGLMLSRVTGGAEW